MTDPKAQKHEEEKAWLRAQLAFLRKIHREDVARLHRALRAEVRRRHAAEDELAAAKKLNAEQWKAQRETMLAVGRTATGKPLNGQPGWATVEEALEAIRQEKATKQPGELFLGGAPVRAAP
jgi:hypothetical protein